MKSVKPGRGPSMMSGIMGIFVALFGVIWTIMALAMGGGFIALFGVIFIGIAVAQTVYHFKNAKSPNRFSSFDIVDSSEEVDPWNEKYGAHSQSTQKAPGTNAGFCPYCGKQVQQEFEFCPGCGKELP